VSKFVLLPVASVHVEVAEKEFSLLFGLSGTFGIGAWIGLWLDVFSWGSWFRLSSTFYAWGVIFAGSWPVVWSLAASFACFHWWLQAIFLFLSFCLLFWFGVYKVTFLNFDFCDCLWGWNLTFLSFWKFCFGLL
jgi:hypothetical protein